MNEDEFKLLSELAEELAYLLYRYVFVQPIENPDEQSFAE